MLLSFRGFTLPEMVTVSGPWATPDHSERQSLITLPSTTGMVRFIDPAHAELLALLTEDERARLGLLRDGASFKNLRHDDLARVSWFSLLAHEYLHRNTPEGRAITDVRTVLFPDNLAIVRAGFRESAGRAEARAAQLTPERTTVLAAIPVQGRNLLEVVQEWNRTGLEMGGIQDQRVTPTRRPGERSKRQAARARWLRVIKNTLNALELEAEESPEAQRILDRVAGIQAEVRRRLRASNGNAPDGGGDGQDDGNEPDDDIDDGIEDGDDIDDELGTEPGEAQDALPAPAAQRR